MGISEEINQKHFKSSQQKATLNLIYTTNWINERVRVFLSQFDLTNQQFNVLRILRGNAPKPLSTQQIRDRMLDKMSDTSRIVDRLVKKELVKKATSKEDKRLVDVSITEKGLLILEGIDAQENSLYQQISKLSEKEAELLSDLCDRLRA